MRAALKLKIVVALFAVVLAMSGTCVAAQSDETPSKELVQYVHEATRRGLAEAKIKKQAVEAGWTESAVDQAIANEKSGKKTVAAVNPGPGPASGPPPVADTAAAAVERPPDPPAGVPKTPQGMGDDYLIGSGDTIQVAVWKEPEASVPSTVVRPDGKITVPLIKEVEVAGQTPRQAEAVITEKLAKFITDPNVTVVVATINSKKVYLIGAVRKEGVLPYTYGMTVMQALSEAGGLNDYAKRKKIYILRNENGREYRLDFNYEEVIRGERMEQNVVLLSGDTVVVPQ